MVPLRYLPSLKTGLSPPASRFPPHFRVNPLRLM